MMACFRFTLALAFLLAPTAVQASGTETPSPAAGGKVEVNARPLKPDPAKLAALGLTEGDVESPVAVRREPPAYPKAAVEKRIQGRVSMRCVIQASGVLDQCSVTKALSTECDAAALAAAKEWRYTPTKVKGKAVPAYLTVDIDFRLSGRR